MRPTETQGGLEKVKWMDDDALLIANLFRRKSVHQVGSFGELFSPPPFFSLNADRKKTSF